MRIYVASKFNRAADVKVVQGKLKAAGHTITLDWTSHTVAGLTGQEREDALARFAQLDLDGVVEADALVMVHDEASRGAFCEVGIALGRGIPVYVLGGRGASPDRAPIFYSLPYVRHFDTVEELLELFSDPAFCLGCGVIHEEWKEVP